MGQKQKKNPTNLIQDKAWLWAIVGEYTQIRRDLAVQKVVCILGCAESLHQEAERYLAYQMACSNLTQ